MNGPPIKVWVTRDEPPDGPLCTALRSRGLDPICEPVVHRRITTDIAPHLRALGPRDWLALTSTFAIEAIDPKLVPGRVAVVGESSRAAAVARGLRVERTSPDGTGEGLWQSLQANSDGATHILYPRSSLAQAPNPWPGITLTSPILYTTELQPVSPAAIQGIIIAAIASPSAAEAVAKLAPGIHCASVGPTTSAALRARGIEPWLESPKPDFVSLAESITTKLRES
jgi:uroporphyrinogen-III synthase